MTTYRIDGMMRIVTEREGDRWTTKGFLYHDVADRFREIMKHYAEEIGKPLVREKVSFSEHEARINHQETVDSIDSAAMAYTFGETA